MLTDPPPGWAAHCIPPGSDLRPRHGTTDEDGRFRIEGLSDAEYRLLARARAAGLLVALTFTEEEPDFHGDRDFGLKRVIGARRANELPDGRSTAAIREPV